MPERDAAITWDHIAHSPNCSIAKARALLNYEPSYTSLDAVQESVRWLIEQGKVAGPAIYYTESSADSPTNARKSSTQ